MGDLRSYGCGVFRVHDVDVCRRVCTWVVVVAVGSVLGCGALLVLPLSPALSSPASYSASYSSFAYPLVGVWFPALRGVLFVALYLLRLRLFLLPTWVVAL